MSNDDRLSALERKLQYLTDRQEILDCIVRTSRGNDRFDAGGISASYHEDGLHDLGQKLILGPDYGAHANHAHAAICEVNLHNVTMHSCEIDGPKAMSLDCSLIRVARQREFSLDDTSTA